jgi:hypothetical protein
VRTVKRAGFAALALLALLGAGAALHRHRHRPAPQRAATALGPAPASGEAQERRGSWLPPHRPELDRPEDTSDAAIPWAVGEEIRPVVPLTHAAFERGLADETCRCPDAACARVVSRYYAAHAGQAQLEDDDPAAFVDEAKRAATCLSAVLPGD